MKLPRPANMTFLDELASLRIVGRKVYWAARIDTKPTILRYDLDAPGDAFVYPAYATAADGAVGTRGRVATDSFKFLFNFARTLPSGALMPPESVIAQGTRTSFSMRSIHRGLAHGFEPSGAVSGAGFWGFDAAIGSKSGVEVDSDDIFYGAAAVTGNVAVQVDEPTVLFTYLADGLGDFTQRIRMTAPAPIRDLTYMPQNQVVAIASGRREVYLFDEGGKRAAGASSMRRVERTVRAVRAGAVKLPCAVRRLALAERPLAKGLRSMAQCVPAADRAGEALGAERGGGGLHGHLLGAAVLVQIGGHRRLAPGQEAVAQGG